MEQKIAITEKSLTEAHLSQFSKEDLIQLIVENKKTLV